MRLVLTADIHEMHNQLTIPDGDAFICAGDITMSGDLRVLVSFKNWISALPHKHKIVIAGNHDWCFEDNNDLSKAILEEGCTYLQDSSIVIDGIKVYGSPWQPRFFDWAFNLDRGAPIKAKWDKIPEDTDVLVTHGPPAGHGDVTIEGDMTGCEDLKDAIQRVQPKVHVFGHIHEGYGVTMLGKTRCVNASVVDRRYRPIQDPIVITL